MKKLAVSLALAAMSLAVHAQNVEASISTDLVAASEVSRFVDHPYNCMHMLGGSDAGDQLPASYSIALDASLKEINAPTDQAIAQINARCTQRVSELNAQRVERVSDLSNLR
jgi:hypothetical protein